MTDEEQMSEAKQNAKHDRRKGKTRAHGTGSVFQRKDRKGKQWVAQIFLENGKTRQRYFSTEKEAAEALHTMLYEQRQGTLITEHDQTVTQHFERWLAVHKTKIRNSTYLTYRSALDRHIPPLDGSPLKVRHHGEELLLSLNGTITRSIPPIQAGPRPTQPQGRAPIPRRAPGAGTQR